MYLSTDIHGVFVLILAGFTFGSTFLSTYSVLNAVRLRNVRLSWKAGKMGGYPLFSTVFMLTSFLLGGIVYQMSIEQYYPVVGCYIWIGFNWFVASFLASKRFITDHGIVKNINDPSQTIAWYQMTDFVEKPSERGNHYIFIYQEHGFNEGITSKCTRLEIKVPLFKLDEFKKIVSYKLGKTISPEFETLTDTGALR